MMMKDFYLSVTLTEEAAITYAKIIFWPHHKKQSLVIDVTVQEKIKHDRRRQYRTVERQHILPLCEHQ